MYKVQCRDLIEKFYQDEVRRSIKVNTNQKFNRKKTEGKTGVAKAAPKKRGKK